MRSFLLWLLASFFALAFPGAASADSGVGTAGPAAPEQAATASGRSEARLFLA